MSFRCRFDEYISNSDGLYLQVFFKVFIKKNKIISIVLHKRIKELRFVGQKGDEMSKEEREEIERLIGLSKEVISKALHIGDHANAVSLVLSFLDKLKTDLGVKGGEKEGKKSKKRD